MAEIFTDIIAVLVHGAKEIFAIVSNVAAFYSAFMTIITLLQLISNQGVISGALTWIIISIVTSVITGLIAEALDSAIPSPFRWGCEVNRISNSTLARVWSRILNTSHKVYL